MRAVETAAFFLCLEPDLVAPDREALARAVLHGDPANRWYDRTSQLILFGAPYIAVNGEHSAIDGHAVTSLIEAILERARPARGVAPCADNQACAPLRWRLDAFRDTIAAARAASAAATVPHLHVGAARSGGSTIRDDTRFQLAVQLAHLELTGRVAGVYQPTHMRRYAGGRTEVVRSASAQSLALCHAIASGRARGPELHEQGRRAVHAVLQRARAAQDGNGVDRHLFALLQVARRRGEMPELFRDPTFAEVLGPAILCTSSLSGFPHLDLIVFAPVRADGFGIAYVPGPEGISLCVTSHRADTPEFVQRLAAACATLRPILHAGVGSRR